MTISNAKGKKAPKSAKKLSLKKETVKDLDAGRGKAKELGEDQLDAVNGGHAAAGGAGLLRPKTQQCLPRSAVLVGGCLVTRPSCEQTTPVGGC